MATRAPPGTRELFSPSASVTVLHQHPSSPVYAVCDGGRRYVTDTYARREGEPRGAGCDVDFRDTLTGEIVETLTTTKGSVSTVLPSPDGTRVATWDLHYAVTIYARPSGRVVATLAGVPSQFGRMCWTADSALLLAQPQSSSAPYTAHVIERDGRRRDDLALPEEMGHLAAAEGHTLIATAWSPGTLWRVDLAAHAVGAALPMPSTVDGLAVRGRRVVVACRPADLALTAVDGAPGDLWPAQALLDGARHTALDAVVPRAEARRAVARGARACSEADEMIARATARRDAPPSPDAHARRWNPGLAPSHPSYPGVRAVHFVDDRSVVTVGLDEATLTRFTDDGATETLLLSIAPKHAGRIGFGAVSACGDVLALGVDSMSKTVQRYTALVRVGATA